MGYSFSKQILVVQREPKRLEILNENQNQIAIHNFIIYFFSSLQVRIWNHTPERAKEFVKKSEHRHNCVACDSAEEAVKEADVVVTVTSSSTPVVKAQWIKPGAHLNGLYIIASLSFCELKTCSNLASCSLGLSCTFHNLIKSCVAKIKNTECQI